MKWYLNCEGPENIHNRLVCAGPCPAGCKCSDGWALDIMARVWSNNSALAYDTLKPSPYLPIFDESSNLPDFPTFEMEAKSFSLNTPEL